jgi:hypothetical protein
LANLLEYVRISVWIEAKRVKAAKSGAQHSIPLRRRKSFFGHNDGENACIYRSARIIGEIRCDQCGGREQRCVATVRLNAAELKAFE